jgi:hypothetical protein
MDARTGFAAGGFIVGATVVAVACAVTLSSSAALADVPGTLAGLGTVRISPSGAHATPSPRASAPVAVAPEISAPATSEPAEVVPAPEPHDVSAAVESQAASAPAAPAAVAPDYPAGRGSNSNARSHPPQTPAHAGNESGRSSSDVKKTQSPKPPRGD